MSNKYSGKLLKKKETRKVHYIYSPDFVRAIAKLPRVVKRHVMVHDLLVNYQLTELMVCIAPFQATQSELTAFHSEDYIKYLKSINDMTSTDSLCDKTTAKYGLGKSLEYDCEIVPQLYDIVRWVAGGTLMAAELLVKEECQVAINWGGGWHHAKKDQASGFCYVNDIVLGILKLEEKFNKVLYLDFDLHHGDGVEEAFIDSSNVFCVSFHNYGNHFFPGTGSEEDQGKGNASQYTLNLPLKEGIGDKNYVRLVTEVLTKVRDKFNPKAVVVQCGADNLAGDPMKVNNLTFEGYGECVKFVHSWNLPLLLLGGGGYNLPYTARCWTYLTSIVLGKTLSEDIPFCDTFEEHGPAYTLHISPFRKKDENSPAYLDSLIANVEDRLKKVVS